MWTKRNKKVPQVGDFIYIVMFTHHETSAVMKYLFAQLWKAESFIDTLDELARPTLYRTERLS